MLVNGKWVENWQPVQAKDGEGRFIRQSSSFRHQISAEGEFTPEAGRYRLYAALICPWASRCLIARNLKGLQGVVEVSLVNPVLTDQGWAFGAGAGFDLPADPELGARHIHALYTKADPSYTGRATVPVLWDRKTQTIVNNESADILRIFNSGFGALASGPDLAPEADLAALDTLNARLYDGLNNGVYKAGFATTQAAYDEAQAQVFETLDWVESLLADGRPWLMGPELTEADIRLFVTTIRFDAAYYGLFKTNQRQIRDYPHVQAHMQRMLALEGLRETVDFDHIIAGYASIKAINPLGLRPKLPAHLAGL